MEDTETLKQISSYMDELIRVTQLDRDLQGDCASFQCEHASARAEFSRSLEETSEPKNASSTLKSDGGKTSPSDEKSFTMRPRDAHLLASLKRMSEFALTSALVILERQSQRGKSPRPSCDTLPQKIMERSGSVEVFDEEDEVERCAIAMRSAAKILALVIIAAPTLQSEIQAFLLQDRRLMLYVSRALDISKDVEMQFFIEGFRTDHMNILANLSYECPQACKSIVETQGMMERIMCSTKIDEDNPGLCEWSQFVIRNLCGHSPEAREVLQSLQLMKRSKAAAGREPTKPSGEDKKSES